MPSVVTTTGSTPSVSVPGTDANGTSTKLLVPAFVAVDGTGAISTGGGGGGGGATTIADGADVALGTTTDAAITNPATAGTLVAFFKGAVSRLGAILTAVAAATPDTVIASGSIDPTTINSLFSVTPNGNGTVVLKIGTLGTTFPGGAVVTFEKVGVPGATAIATSVYPRGAANSGRIRSTTVGGEFIFPSEAAVSIQARISTVGTGAVIPVSVQMAAPPAIQPVAPVNVGQTTRAYDTANKQRLTVTGTDAASSAISASEVLLHARTSAMWLDFGTAAIAASAPLCLEAGEKLHMQITPGTIVHAIQDTAAGVLVILPVL